MQMPNFQDLKYERPSVNDFREVALSTRLRLMTSKDMTQIELALAEFQKALSAFYTAQALCQIRFDQDTNNAFFGDEMTFFEENEPMVSELSSVVYSALVNSDIADELKGRFGFMIFKKAINRKETVSSAVLEELAQEATLANEYDQILAQAQISFSGKVHTLSMMAPFLESVDRNVRKNAYQDVSGFYQQNKATFESIFDRLVGVRDSVAQKLEYASFVDLGYKRMERYDFTEENVAQFRDMIVRYIVPLTIEIRRLQSKRLDISNLKYYDLSALFLRGNPTPKVSVQDYPEVAGKMFAKIFGKTPCFFDILHTRGFTDLMARKAKSAGAYCVDLLDYGVPYIFMNANSTGEDVTTIIHESGHAYASIRSADASPFIECLSPTLETCEIHSTALEYLSYPHLEMFFENKAEAFRQLHMAQSLLFLPYGCMVDEFQHEIYKKPNMTSEQRHMVWSRLEKKYQPFLDYDDEPFHSSGASWMKKGHIFTDPFYYIDYCLAQIVSLQIWDMARISPSEALRVYDQLCKAGGNMTFLDLIKKTGLKSPFDVGVIKRIAYRTAEYLQL